MKKWLRLIFEAVLFALLAGASVFIYLQMDEIEALENSIAATQEKQNSQSASNSNSDQSRLIIELKQKSKEYDAIKSALSGGQALLDIENAASKAKIDSPERFLAIGALRLLVKGKDDPSTVAAFEKALEMVEWNSKLRSVCAAQAGMAASGKDVGMLSDCSRLEELERKPKSPKNLESGDSEQGVSASNNATLESNSGTNETGI